MNAAYWLPVIFAGLMGLAMLVYVVLDGFDLGVGLLLPLAGDGGESLFNHTHQKRDGCDFWTRSKIGGDGRRRTLINIGRPHVKRYGRDFERKTGKHKHQAENDADGSAA